MTLLQILVLLFAVFAFSRAVLRFKDKKISLGEFIFWTFVWVSVIVTTWLPGTATMVSQFFGISRPIDLAVYSSILVLFYLVFRLYVYHEMQRREITKLVREVAIKKVKKKK